MSKSSLILFGAGGGINNKMKGFDLLKKSIKFLVKNKGDFKSKYELIVFGCGQPEDSLDIGIEVKFLGAIQNETAMALLYS